MGNQTGTDGMAEAIMKEMERYAVSTGETVKQIAKEVSADAAKELKGTSPKRTGAYAKSWRSKKKYENSHSAGYLVYSKGHYRLTHLLEKGHAGRNGGRKVAAVTHIGPAEEKAVREFQEKLKENLS